MNTLPTTQTIHDSPTAGKVKFSLRYKFLFLLTFLLIASLGLNLFVSIQTVEQDRTAQTYDMTQSSVTNLASDLQSVFKSVLSTFKLFALNNTTLGAPYTESAFRGMLESDPHLVHLSLYREGLSHEFEVKSEVSNSSYSENAESGSTQNSFSAASIPFQKITENAVAVWHLMGAHNLPLLGVGIAVEETRKHGGSNVKSVVVGYLRADRILASMKRDQTMAMFLLSRSGDLLLGVDENHPSLKGHPLLGGTLDDAVSVVKRYQYQGQDLFGASTSVGFADLVVISEVKASEAFKSVTRLVIHTLTISAMIVALTFLAMLYFARSLTSPLFSLTTAMENIRSNPLKRVEVEIKTQDEIGLLARVFNSMIKDLTDSQRSLEESNLNLEKKVAERTHALREMTIRDPLTGLFNRRHFNDRLKEIIAKSKEENQEIGIIYSDIDHFKKYNDGNGHPEGDVLLKMFSKMLLENIRPTDLIARLGGEEFCIILPQTDLESTRQHAERLRKLIETHDFPHGEKQPLGRVTVSLGVSSFPDCGRDEEELIKAADEALYEIKKTSRNAVAVARSTSGTQKIA